jgi:DNA-binding Lrp family transcriptional regulator
LHSGGKHVLANCAICVSLNATFRSRQAKKVVIMPNSDLDAIDRQIITELQADARLSNVALADKVGLSPSPCLRRVKRLEREGYIEGYRAALRRDRIGLGFSVFVGVKIEGHANERALRFEEAVNAMPEVIACISFPARPTTSWRWLCRTWSTTNAFSSVSS